MTSLLGLVFALALLLWLVALVYPPVSGARPWLAWVSSLLLGLALFGGLR